MGLRKGEEGGERKRKGEREIEENLRDTVRQNFGGVSPRKSKFRFFLRFFFDFFIFFHQRIKNLIQIVNFPLEEGRKKKK